MYLLPRILQVRMEYHRRQETPPSERRRDRSRPPTHKKANTAIDLKGGRRPDENARHVVGLHVGLCCFDIGELAQAGDEEEDGHEDACEAVEWAFEVRHRWVGVKGVV